MRLTTIKQSLLVCVSTILAGCSVLNTAGDSTFSCPGLPQGITCKTPSAVYKSSNGQLPIAESDLPMGRSPVAIVERERSSKGRSSIADDSTPNINNEAYAHKGVKLPLPVRSSAKVMRIWIAPWIDKNDDLHLPSFLYTEVATRKWNLGEADFIGNGVTVPYRVIEQSPSQNSTGQNAVPVIATQAKSSQPTTRNTSFNNPAERVQAPDDLNLGDQ